MCRRHPDVDAKPGRGRASRHDLFTASDLADQRERRMLGARERNGASALGGLQLALERMTCSLRSASELPHGRLRMLGQRVDLLLHIASIHLSPASARPPSTSARNGAGTRIVVDRKLKRRPLRLRPGGPFQPPQPLDGQVRQEQRDDPSHRIPPGS